MEITNVGENIKKIRKLKNMTVQELGEKIGLKPAAVSKYEVGTVSPTIQRLEEIAAALDTDIFTLLFGKSFEATKSEIIENERDKLISACTNALEPVTNELRAEIESLKREVVKTI